jgi:hypothetical protein
MINVQVLHGMIRALELRALELTLCFYSDVTSYAPVLGADHPIPIRWAQLGWWTSLT